ncbi:hypothetical protein G6F29_013545 [Rhizopus arrhizus]|nr:hypothetical protein G6F29_013545 [Rhizopus arrhizus]KAG0973742.1 hypothetical protein G6F28_013492 [Rhizopus arrhizus]KAG1311000.1 hypothetical protein G6F62_014512 [Rhizopus arrhizus]KAG1322107.1 hypothetical protein G6F63_013515 [Rhizopus arrhizus]
MEARLKWAKAHKDWTEDDWRRVVFSDETKINVWGSDGCKYFWRRPGDKLQSLHLDLRVKGGAGSITILSTHRSLLMLGLKKMGLKKSTPSIGLLKALIWIL